MACKSAYSLRLVKKGNWSIGQIKCLLVIKNPTSKLIAAGKTSQSLYYELVYPNGEIWSSNIKLPSQLSFQAYFSPYHLLSNIDTLLLS